MTHIREIFMLLMLLISAVLTGQNSKKGYKALEKLDYEKAKQAFEDIISSDQQNPAANFGLAVVYADENSPYYNLIDSWSCVRVLQANIDHLNQDEMDAMAEYFLNTEKRPSNWPVKKKIQYAVDAIQAKLIKYIREENNLDIVYQVLNKFPDFKYYENVVHIRNQLEFRKYEKQNTLDGYIEFINKFPDAAQIDKAVTYRNHLAFVQAQQMNTPEAYENYMKNYPAALDYNSAVKARNAAAFQEAKQKNTIQAYDAFISNYPDALEVAGAKGQQKQLLYEYAKRIQSLEAYNEFIRKYPEGQQYIDIFNLKSLDLGKKYLAGTPFPSANIQWARIFEVEKYRVLTACVTVDTTNSYILGGTVLNTDSSSTDAWILKLTSDGKMLWNKFIGEAFNDELTNLTINKKGEILGIGHTWLSKDSLSRESWLFKLGSDGQKLWSRNLGSFDVRSIKTITDGSIILGGFQHSDSTGDKYAMMVLNNFGKKLWARTYTGNGIIQDVSLFPDQKILASGSQWSVKMDTKGYLIWEFPFNSSDSITTANILKTGEICYGGLRNRSNVLLVKVSADGKKIYEKEYTVSDSLISVNRILDIGSGKLLALCTLKSGSALMWINSGSGQIEKSLKLPENIPYSDIVLDMQNNILLTFANGNITLLKNLGTTF